MWCGRSLFLHPGLADRLIGTPCLVLFSNIGTPHAEKTASHWLKNTLYKILCPLIADRSLRSGKSVQDAKKAAVDTQIQLQRLYNQHAHELSTQQVGNHVAIQNPMWDIYGIISAIVPFRRYFVKTRSGRVLVRIQLLISFSSKSIQ